MLRWQASAPVQIVGVGGCGAESSSTSATLFNTTNNFITRVRVGLVSSERGRLTAVGEPLNLSLGPNGVVSLNDIKLDRSLAAADTELTIVIVTAENAAGKLFEYERRAPRTSLKLADDSDESRRIEKLWTEVGYPEMMRQLELAGSSR